MVDLIFNYVLISQSAFRYFIHMCIYFVFHFCVWCVLSRSLSLSPVFHLSIDGVPGVHGINQLLFLSVSFPVAEGRGEERQTQGKSLECHHIHQLTHTHT